MPNWVNNDIIIKGHPRTIQRLVKALQSKDDNGEVNHFDFNKVIPCPEELNKNDWQSDKAVAAANKEKYGYEGWYDWNVANWGTKWNSCNSRTTNLGNGQFYFGFETAWSPLDEKFLSRLTKRFPSLTFIYEFHEEAEMYPSERQTWKDGEKIDSIEIENTNTTDEDEEVDWDEIIKRQNGENKS